MLTIDEHNACFDGDTSPHAHFQCKECGTIYDIPIPEMKGEEETGELAEKGFRIDETQLYYKGLCPQCSKKYMENNPVCNPQL